MNYTLDYCNPPQTGYPFAPAAASCCGIPSSNIDVYRCHPSPGPMVYLRSMDIPTVEEIKRRSAQEMRAKLEKASLELLEFYQPGHEHIEFTELLSSDPFLDYE